MKKIALVLIAVATIITCCNSNQTSSERPIIREARKNYPIYRYIDLEENIVCYTFKSGSGSAISCVKR